MQRNTTNIIFSLFNHDFQVTCSFLPKPAYSQPFIFNLSGLVCLVFGTRIYKTPHLIPHQVSNTVRAEPQQITADAAGPRLSIASDEDAWGGPRRSRKKPITPCERSECQSRVRGGRDWSHPSCTTSRHVMHTVMPLCERNIYFPVRRIGRSRWKVGNDELTMARWLLGSISLSSPRGGRIKRRIHPITASPRR